MIQSHRSIEVEIQEPNPSQKDWPSYLYVAAFITNSLIICALEPCLAAIPFVVMQGIFFVGLLELTHQSVHRNFVMNRSLNEVFGTFASTLIGFNLIAYRHFHLQHHQHTCDTEDPEGLLYADSPKTKWFFFGAPISHIWVAIHINYLAKKYVPRRKKHEWVKQREIMVVLYSFLALFAFVSFDKFLMVYLIPFCLFTWLDFFFSQAEHYDADIRPAGESANVADVTHDIKLPYCISVMMLHRSLHSIHHVWPRTRWYESPAKLNYLQSHNGKQSMTFPEFLQRWMAQGPRLWPK